MEVLLYKLKDERNLEEILNICKRFGIRVYVIAREGADINYDKLKKVYEFEIYNDFKEFYEKNKEKRYLILETYGNKLLGDIDPKDYDIIVLGAEDYGFPIKYSEIIERKDIVKIKTRKPGSYNVVSTLVMLLTEIFL